MPWISVHQEVDGTKLRRLYRAIGCSKFEALGILNFLWFWGMKNADEVALLAEGVDRNGKKFGFALDVLTSPSSRRAWIEIGLCPPPQTGGKGSPSSRRAQVEIDTKIW